MGIRSTGVSSDSGWGFACYPYDHDAIRNTGCRICIPVDDADAGRGADVSSEKLRRITLPGTQFEDATIGSPVAITQLIHNKAAGTATIRWASRAGGIYAVETSSNLRDWIELDDRVESEGEETSFSDREAFPGQRQRYYRVLDTARGDE